MLRIGKISPRSITLTALAYLLTGSIFYLAFTHTGEQSEFLSSLRIVLAIILLPIILKFLVQLLVAPFSSLVDLFRERSGSGEKPMVSVLIPAWNEEVGILNTQVSGFKNSRNYSLSY
ncbi:MAG: hypothetical protein SWN10_21060 [Pseudomonadota bacterium]|nr:hypothetical protein [Pseudomonadota bacterium]